MCLFPSWFCFCHCSSVSLYDVHTKVLKLFLLVAPILLFIQNYGCCSRLLLLYCCSYRCSYLLLLYCCSYRTTVAVLACCSCIVVHRELELLFLLVAPGLLFIQMFLLVAPVLLFIQNYGCCSCFCSCYIAVPFYAVIPAHLSSPYSRSKLIKTCCCAKY